MKRKDDFQVLVKEIADIAFTSGINAISKSQYAEIRSTKSVKSALSQKFITECHKGYNQAQILILNEKIFYQNQLKSAKEKLKQSRINNNKSQIQLIIEKIQIINDRILILTHIADGIAWLLIKGEIHIARRFYIGQNEIKHLDLDELSQTLSYAERINSNPLNFALISDLTSYIQIGDLLVRENNELKVIELKQGKVNNEILSKIRNVEEKDGNVKDKKHWEKFDNKTKKQIQRIIKQKEKAKNLLQVVNNDEGIDPRTNQRIEILTPLHSPQHYLEYLHDIDVKLKQKPYLIQSVENCLYIGAYKDDAIEIANPAMNLTMKSKCDNYLIINWKSIIKHISQPLFAKPIPTNIIFDVLFDDMIILFGIDLDQLINIFSSQGLKTMWMTKKETSKLINHPKSKGLFIHNNKGIKSVNSNGKVINFGWGLISKLVYDNMTPSSICNSLLYVK